MSRRGRRGRHPRPVVSITVKVDPDVAERIYRIADEHYKGNVSWTIRESIALLFREKGSA